MISVTLRCMKTTQDRNISVFPTIQIRDLKNLHCANSRLFCLGKELQSNNGQSLEFYKIINGMTI